MKKYPWNEPNKLKSRIIFMIERKLIFRKFRSHRLKLTFCQFRFWRKNIVNGCIQWFKNLKYTFSIIKARAYFLIFKKYPWNEPNPKKRLWSKKDYDYFDWKFICEFKRIGLDLRDLNPFFYSDGMFGVMLLSRSPCDPKYGNIDDLDPRLFSCAHMKKISIMRAKRKIKKNHHILKRIYNRLQKMV